MIAFRSRLEAGCTSVTAVGRGTVSAVKRHDTDPQPDELIRESAHIVSASLS